MASLLNTQLCFSILKMQGKSVTHSVTHITSSKASAGLQPLPPCSLSVVPNLRHTPAGYRQPVLQLEKHIVLAVSYFFFLN